MSLLQVSCMNFKQPSRVESIKKTRLLQDRSQHRKRQSPGKRSKESKERSRDKSHDVCNEKGAVVVRQPPKQDLLLLKLKSCLRNPEDKDRRRSHGLKVTFLLPKEDKKEHSKCYYEPPVLTDELFKLRIQ
ncbi:hypothetical protein IFM89_010368 [Coptis chinensis]|uniref:Uncharacterized protein n=1 Tax=Coptis chinensis TaxID=261450 RepID=A0A835HV90_9MAGN|nr:hypothetical protein IFM89_010368 [Coptis chinensis]